MSDEPVSDDRRVVPPVPGAAGSAGSGPARAAAPVPEGEARPAGELGYAEASAELEAIIAELDQGLVDVDHLEVRFRRAIEIVEELDRRIHRARSQVDALLPRLGAIGGASGAASAPSGAGGNGPAAERADRPEA